MTEQEELISKEQELKQVLLSYHNQRELYRALVQRARALESLKEAERSDDTLVPACLSKLWLVSSWEGERIFFRVDGESLIAKGLASLLLELFNGHSGSVIQAHRCALFESEGLRYLLPSSKRNGLSQLLARIYAAAAYTSCPGLPSTRKS